MVIRIATKYIDCSAHSLSRPWLCQFNKGPQFLSMYVYTCHDHPVHSTPFAVTFDPLLKRLLVFPSMFRYSVESKRLWGTWLNSPYNCGNKWALLCCWLDTGIDLRLPRHDGWKLSKCLALHEWGPSVLTGLSGFPGVSDVYLGFRYTLVPRCLILSPPSSGQKLVIIDCSAKLYLKGTDLHLRKHCRTVYWTTLWRVRQRKS